MSEPEGWEYARKLIAAEKVARTGKLDLGSLGLKDLPEELFELQDLKQLHLGSAVRDAAEIWVNSENNYYSNDIGENLAKLKKLPNLVDLSLENSYLSSVLPLSSLTYLRSLDFQNTNISDLTPLTGMTQLQSLDFRFTQVSDLTPLAGMTQLQSLDFRFTQVSDLTPLAGMTQLQSLNCGGTQISKLTPLAGLTQLQSLYCWNTQVSDLTPLAGMTGLKEIRLTDTKIETIPEWLVRLPHLEKLSISSPNVRGIPAEILTKAWNDNCLDRLRAHFDDLAKGVERFTDVKMIVIGNGQIGKTKICQRLSINDYDPCVESTHGIVVRPVEKWSLDDVPGRKGEHARLNLWDFGGQDLYHGTHTLFLNSRSIFMIVWTPESEESESHTFDDMSFPNHKLPYWLENVRHAAGTDQPVIIVQNQCDTGEEEEQLPEIDKELLDSFKHKKICQYSALNNRNRASLNNIISEAIAANWRRYGKSEIGKGRMRVIREIEKLRKTKTDGKNRTITRKKFDAFCNKKGDVSSPEMLLEFLNDTGILIYRPNLFKGEIIIDQNWALEAVYSVFDRKKSYDLLKRMGGKFKRTDLQTMVWQSYTVPEQELFLSWMVSCGNCFIYSEGDRYKGTETEYMAPELLPEINAQEGLFGVWGMFKNDTIHGFDVALPFLHPGLIQSLICKVGELAQNNATYAKTGLCFKDFKTKSLCRIEQVKDEDKTRHSGRLQVRTRAGEASQLLALMRQWLEDILTEQMGHNTNWEIKVADGAVGQIELRRDRTDNSQKLELKTMIQVSETTKSDFHYVVLIITVNSHETRAICDLCFEKTNQQAKPERIDGRTYNDLGTINGTRIFHTISEMGTSGPGAMQSTVNKAITAVKPAAVIALGIAFGVDPEKQKLGDILVSKQILLYDNQKIKDGEIILRGDKSTASVSLLNHFNTFSQSSRQDPNVQFGLILSGEKLIDDIDYRKSLQELQQEAIGGEMEGAGLYVAAADLKVDWILIKAICDWADGNKSDNKEELQKTAAMNAAKFLVGSLEYCSLAPPIGGNPMPLIDFTPHEQTLTDKERQELIGKLKKLTQTDFESFVVQYHAKHNPANYQGIDSMVTVFVRWAESLNGPTGKLLQVRDDLEEFCKR